MMPVIPIRLRCFVSLGVLFSFYETLGDIIHDFPVHYPDEVADRIEEFKDDPKNLTMCLLSIMVRANAVDYGVKFTSYEHKGRFYEKTAWQHPLDQFEIIQMARKFIDAGADMNGHLPEDYTVDIRSGQRFRRYEYKENDNAIILALKSGYDYVAYALYAYTNAPVPLTTESRNAVDAYANTNAPSMFLTLVRETDKGLIERLTSPIKIPNE